MLVVITNEQFHFPKTQNNLFKFSMDTKHSNAFGKYTFSQVRNRIPIRTFPIIFLRRLSYMIFIKIEIIFQP